MAHILIAGSQKKTDNYTNALIKLGATCESSFYPSWDNYDGLILPGGGDIDPAFFQQDNLGSMNIQTEVDYLQFEQLQHFVAHNKPVLGICKGMQLINVYFNGTIIQDLPTKSIHQFQQKDQFHMTFIKKDSFLESLYGSAIITNSAHHQGIGKLGQYLIPIQQTKDEVIEGIVHEHLPIIGVQWHPERMCTATSNVYVANGEKLFRHFLSLCELF